MNQEFNPAGNVYVDRDEHGVVRQLSHLNDPYVSLAHTPQLVVGDYLQRFADLIGLKPEQLKNLASSPSSTIENTSVEYRFLEEKNQFDTTTVGYYQTILGLPVWQAGLAIQIKQNPFRVLSSQSTQHPDLSVKKPSDEAIKRAESIGEIELASRLGLVNPAGGAGHFDLQSLKIEKRSLVVYRYEAAKRLPDPPPQTIPPQPNPNQPAPGLEDGFVGAPKPTLPLPPVADGIVERQHYVCVKIDFALNYLSIGLLHWVAILDVETLSVLYLRPFVDHVNGLVFDVDPITTNGGPAATANTAALNAVRVSRTLQGLAAPMGGTQSLTGDTIQMSDAESPVVAAPTEPAATNFNFDSRTNDFAAVNAYYHCDGFFRLLDGMGFSRASFLGATSFPSTVDHRGSINTSNGIEVNAHCVGNAGGHGINRTTFALADTGDSANPIGIACDYRVVLHELAGHGVLYNHVDSPNFGFSHSAGDSVAAILSDPGSQAPDRFVTFPWVNIGRRHDRTPAVGWGYAGTIALNPFSSSDGGGYNNEQILSTTHFRIYRSLGGDSSDINTKRFAARMTVYLIMRAIASLTPATNPANASGFATALMTADLGDWVSENITGGAYNKVIRWAFEKQGLYQLAGTATPNNNIGAPPPVDVYIDDGRAGEYQYQPVFWNCQKIWNRRANDGGTTHEEPVTGQTNYGYVKIKNRGGQIATNVLVKAYHANPAAGLSYPIDWTPMTTAQLSAPNVPANNASEITVGPFQWVPTHVGHECMFMIVSANGDASNVNNIAAGDSIPEWRLVPNDNNVGQRNVHPVMGKGTSGLMTSFRGLTMILKNPHLAMARMEVKATLPEVLESRGWKVQFVNAGRAAFPLQPGESREIAIQLVPGAEFHQADIEAAKDRTIHIYGYAGGILVGGNSYELDPNLEGATTTPPIGGECAKIASDLLKCAEPAGKVKKVHVRKVNVDIEFEGDCGCK